MSTARIPSSPTRVYEIDFFSEALQGDVKCDLQGAMGSIPVHFVNVDSMDMTPTEFSALVDCLLPKEREKVLRFRKENDQKLSLVSALLQRRTIRESLCCGDGDYEIMRSKEGKPYPVSSTRPVANWNYNVSHHGSFVGIVSDTDHIVGADVVELHVRRTWTKDAAAYISMFQSQFTPAELRCAKGCRSDVERYRHFFVNWSLKEAYIKAVGTGLQMDLQALHFVIYFDNPDSHEETTGGHMRCRGTAHLYIRGRLRNDWSFVFQELDASHVITVARGPVHDVAPTFGLSAGMSIAAPKEEEPRPNVLSPPSVTAVTPLTMSIRKLALEDLLTENMARDWRNKSAGGGVE